MCRLFGLHAGRESVAATFWLLDAPDSLAAQSHHNPDGAGIGRFDARAGRVVKQPIAAWEDAEFATAAHDLHGNTFVAHVRYATTGAHTVANTHPFQLGEKMFAHNGAISGLDRLDDRLDELAAGGRVGGETDSERIFALITAETAAADGDVAAGITAAIGWIADRLPVFALNFVLITPTDLWALRYPATHELYVLERRAGRSLDARSNRIHAQSDDLADWPSVVIASERLDGEQGWRPMEPGELLHVDTALAVERTYPFPAEPRHRLALPDPDETATGSEVPQSPAR